MALPEKQVFVSDEHRALMLDVGVKNVALALKEGRMGSIEVQLQALGWIGVDRQEVLDHPDVVPFLNK